MIQRIPPGVFCAPSKHPLKKSDLKCMALETAEQVVLSDQNFDSREIVSIMGRVSSEFDRCFSRMNVLDSMYAFPHYRNNFNRESFAARNPDLEAYITPFCFRFRAKVALSLHPEKIVDMAQAFQAANVQSWRPEFLDTRELINLSHWFGANLRNDEGRIDWPLIHEKVSAIYPCVFEYQEQRENFTLASATALARELIDRAVESKGYWNPSSDIDLVDKGLYSFITSRSEFRRPAKRPDIGNRTQSRPNWFAFAEHLGPQYETTLRIGWWNAEQRYRDFGDAVDEWGDMLHAQGYPQWSLNTIYEKNANVYAWFKTHCRSDDNSGIDIRKILEASSQEVREKYTRN